MSIPQIFLGFRTQIGLILLLQLYSSWQQKIVRFKFSNILLKNNEHPKVSMLSQRNLDKIRHLPVHPHLQVNASAFTSFESVYKMAYKNWRWKRAWHHAGKAQQGFTQLVSTTPIPPPPSLSSFNSVPKAGCWAHPQGGCCPPLPFPSPFPPSLWCRRGLRSTSSGTGDAAQPPSLW